MEPIMTHETRLPAGQILVACKDCADCELIRSHFENNGYAVQRCCSLRDFSDSDLSNYSALLMELPENSDDGLQVIEDIKQNDETFDIPLLVYSASRKPDVLVNALNAGADDFIVKPFSVRELSARVRAVLRSCHRL